MARKAKKAKVSLEDFLRVTVVQRSKFPSKESARKALGYKSMQSFSQRLATERKKVEIPHYDRDGGDATESHKDIIARLQAEQSDN